MNADLPTIRAFNEFSEIGLELFAPSIFLGGCNLKCPYCMNSKLARNQSDLCTIGIGEVKRHVKENSCKWVVISGGEPTCTELIKLLNLLREIKSWGCNIGMSTNGTNSETLKIILPYLDYVALDIKSALDKDYVDIGSEKGMVSVLISKSILFERKKQDPSFDYEIRTTLYPAFITLKSIEEIGGIIKKDERWVLQRFRTAKNMLGEEAYKVIPYTEEQITAFFELARKYSDKVALKYV